MLLVPMPRAHLTTATAFVEDVFATYLYTGTGAAQTITNGIDLAGKGGLVWIKGRGNADNHSIYDSSKALPLCLDSADTGGDSSRSNSVTALNSNGFTLGIDGGGTVNGNTKTYASWTFREQPKFFDVVTYTGTGSNTTIAHNLGSVPGCIMVKRTDTTAAWAVYHRSLVNTQYVVLNTTAAAATGATRWNSTTPTSSVFSIGTDATVNASAGTYVAYLFAHDAGGFGLTGTDNVISCGSFTTDGSGDATVSLGYEPQFLLTKRSNTTGAWRIIDSSRGMSVAVGGQGSHQQLFPNDAGTESASGSSDPIVTTATGFSSISNYSSATFIYIAIRRGPMKVPTDATSVYNAIARTGTGAAATVTGVGFAPDLVMPKARSVGYLGRVFDRLRGANRRLVSADTGAEGAATGELDTYDMDGVTLGTGAGVNDSAVTYINHFFKRAPGFFDEVCYTGDGTNDRAITHNLTATPELISVKDRSNVFGWPTWHKSFIDTGYNNFLNTTAATTGASDFSTGPTAFTATTFRGSQAGGANNVSAHNYVAYLFATCPGVSKVGSYTGTGTTNQIDCGFTAGARFVLIKRTDSTGDWYVWDTARGIIAGNDPYLLLNTTAAEVTGTDYIDTYSAGFELSSTAPAALNSSGGTYIFLAIA